MIVELLLQINCKYCHQDFLLCRSCYRGQCYCCGKCRFKAQLESRRRAQQRYRLTEKGREAHRQAEKRRRGRNNRKTSNSVDDGGSTPASDPTKLDTARLNQRPQCCFCGAYGVVVTHFPRRGYGGRSEKESLRPEGLQL